MAKGESVLHETYLKLSEEIQIELKSINVTVTDTFILMLVRVVSLEPENKFIIMQFLEPSEIERIKRVTLERIIGMHPLARNTILMQLHYNTNYFTREELLEAQHIELEKQMKVMLEELVVAIPNQQKHRETYYQKLIFATMAKAGIVVDSGWDVASGFKVLQQTRVALSDVFPLEDIDLLSCMNAEVREEELRNTIQIAIGIRLLNRYLDPVNMSAGIPDLGGTLTEVLERTLNTLFDLRNRNNTRMIYYTTVIKSYFLKTNVTQQYERRGITKDMLLIRQGLTMVHQLLIYCRQLDYELYREEKLSEKLIESLDQGIKNLDSVLRADKSVPMFTVYPKFIELANTWEGIQDSLAFVNNCADLVEVLEDLTENQLEEIDPIVNQKKMLTNMYIPTLDEFLRSPVFDLPSLKESRVRRDTFTEDLNFLGTQYCGFCVWSLVEGFGLPIFSNPSLGIYNWNEKSYLLSTPDAIVDFSKDPETYINKTINIALRWPELIFLLKIQDDVFTPEVAIEAIRATTAPSPFIYADLAIQTELHPIPSNIIPGYSWNEWEYRKRAIFLSNVHKSVTHSTQTNLQSCKDTQGTQTYPLRSRRIQTNRSVYTEAPRSQFYFYGLRGYHCSSLGSNPPHIVELTREPVMDMKIKFSTPIQMAVIDPKKTFLSAPVVKLNNVNY